MNNKQTDIIERAGQVFMKFGIKSVTMKDVANQLGISKKTLYNHFTDKHELILKIIKAKIEQLGKSVKQKVFENSGIKLNWEIERVGKK